MGPAMASATSGLRLAQATGAGFSRSSDGVETIEFPRPREDEAPSTAGFLLRAPDESPPEPGEASAAPAATTVAVAPPPAPAAPQGGSEIDDIYEQVVDRLRRDLLVERERMGDLLGDLP
jgi:hypothetical protein